MYDALKEYRYLPPPPPENAKKRRHKRKKKRNNKILFVESLREINLSKAESINQIRLVDSLYCIDSSHITIA